MPTASTWLIDVGAHDGTTLRTLRFSSGGYRTRPTDTPADTEYPDAIIDPGTISRHLFAEGRTLGTSEVSFGDVTLAYGRTGIDAWMDYGFDGRALSIYRVDDPKAAFSAAELFLKLTMTRVISDDAFRTVKLRLYDRRLELDKPIQNNRYAGTTLSAGATAEGDSSLAGKVKPLVFGKAENVPAAWVNRFNLIYQVHDGAVSSIVVYDRGIALTATSDHPSLAALIAATVPGGKFATCLALGLFRLGASADGIVTADVTEGSTLALRNAAQVALRILARMGISGAANVSSASFTALGALAPAELGIFVGDDGTSAKDVLDAVLGSVGAWLLPNGAGVFETGRLSAPGTSAWSLDMKTIHNEGDAIEIVANPDTDGGLPAWRVLLNYRKLWQVQDGNDVGGCVDAARKTLLATETRQVKAEASSVLTKHLLAPELTIDTLLASQADATAEAARRLALYSARRDVIPLRVRRDDAEAMTMGSTGTVTLPRLGYQAGRKMVVIGREERPAEEMVVLTLWG